MRFFTAILLILLVFSQTYSQLFVLAIFKINQAYIAKNTCENRYRPQMHCNGNCILMRKMKQQEKEEQNSQGNLKLELSTIVLSSRSFFISVLSPELNTRMLSYPVYNAGNPVDRAFAIFHPPQC